MTENEQTKRLAEAMMARDKVFKPIITETQIKAKDMFWCCRNTERIYAKVCINRQEQETESCIRCQQGKLVKRLTIEKLQESRPKRKRTI